MTSANPAKTQRYSYLERIESKLFATSRHLERSVITFRLVAAVPLVLVMFSSRERLPYWEYAVGAIVLMLAVNIWLRHANKSGHLTPKRSALIGSAVDTLLLLLVSNLAIRASAQISSTSEMWLVFPLVILAFVYRTKPIAGIGYSILITGWYAAHILAFFDASDRAMTELPIRATFFVLMGGLAAVLGNSIRQQDTE